MTIKNNKRGRKSSPTYFTPSKKNSITIKYVLFCSDDVLVKQDILNYRTRPIAEEMEVEWFSEVGLGDGDIAAIHIHSDDSERTIECASKIVFFLKKHKIKFIAD